MKDDYEKFNENRLSLNTDIKMTSSGALDSKDSYDRPSSKLSDDGFSIWELCLLPAACKSQIYSLYT